jgi:hypothetical protein
MILLFEFILYISCCVNFFFLTILVLITHVWSFDLSWVFSRVFVRVQGWWLMHGEGHQLRSKNLNCWVMVYIYIYIYIYIYDKYLTFICTPSKSLSSNMSPINRSTSLAIKVFNNLSSALFRAQGLVFLLNHEN